MTRVVVDASAFGALVFQEPEAQEIRDKLRDAVVFAPELLRYELANVAWKKSQRDPGATAKIVAALAIALDEASGMQWQPVNAADVVLMARATSLTSYDATYLWLAGSLGADLVTLDTRLARAHEGLTANPFAR